MNRRDVLKLLGLGAIAAILPKPDKLARTKEWLDSLDCEIKLRVQEACSPGAWETGRGWTFTSDISESRSGWWCLDSGKWRKCTDEEVKMIVIPDTYSPGYKKWS